MVSPEQTEELRVKLIKFRDEKNISMRELGKLIGYSNSQLSRFLKGGYRINDNTYKRIKGFLSRVRSAETFEPIDAVIEHLEKAKSEILKSQKEINELVPFLVKGVGDVVKLREFLLGRR